MGQDRPLKHTISQSFSNCPPTRNLSLEISGWCECERLEHMVQVTGVSTKSKDGKAEKVEADAVIFAIGVTGKQLNAHCFAPSCLQVMTLKGCLHHSSFWAALPRIYISRECVLKSIEGTLHARFRQQPLALRAYLSLSPYLCLADCSP